MPLIKFVKQAGLYCVTWWEKRERLSIVQHQDWFDTFKKAQDFVESKIK